jgi:hypothetical protein
VAIGDVSLVAVETVTDSHSAHRAERASPRKPNVDTDARSLRLDNFEVWCFRPTYEKPFWVNSPLPTYAGPVIRLDSGSIVDDLDRFESVLFEADLCE